MSGANGHPLAPDWIAVDWGTSHLRVWAMDADNQPMAKASSGNGMGALTPEGFEPALLELIEPWLSGPTTVVACGMAGSRQGWAEARYAMVPSVPQSAKSTTRAPASDPRLEVYLLPGLSQSTPADVMRGEETQIAGWLTTHPGFDGVICLPGTHTKWAQISAGEVVSFRTYMTGELFALLSEQSVLRHAVAEDEWDGEAFDHALSDAMARPERLASDLFGIRATNLLSTPAPGTGRAALSGLLIGLELAGSRPYWLGQRIALIGAPLLCDHYAHALSLQAAPVERANGADMTLRGLAAAHAKLKEAAA